MCMSFYSKGGVKPIHIACAEGYLEMMKTLISLGSSPTAIADDEVCVQ